MGRIAKILLIGVIVALCLGGVAFKLYRDKLYVGLPDYPPVKAARWLDQGWNREQRDWFHHADQGTQTLNIPYEWFVALEQPRISLLGAVGRLSDPLYLDRLGFIPGAQDGGEVQLPIGFAKGAANAQGAMRLPGGETWLNPRTGLPMSRIGFTCAACHTGRLVHKETAIVVDGGPALADLGRLRQAVGVSILFTKYIPGRFDRFAMNVLGEDAGDADKAKLKAQIQRLWDGFDEIRKLDKAFEKQNVEEGYGRLDALNRIGNQVFSIDLAAPQNYAAVTSPVAIPHIWNTHWFDWVQYNSSIEQPMVRNAGEALGVAATLNLSSKSGALFQSSVPVDMLYEIEKSLAGAQPTAETGFTGLRAPRWPDDLLGQVRIDAAGQGAKLYDGLCRGCHLPPVGSKAFWDSKRWLAPNEFGQRYLRLTVKPVDDIGTDPAQARDMNMRKVATPPELDLKTDRFGGALGALVEKTVDRWYDDNGVPRAKRDEMNGFRDNGIRDPLCYKARPLNGVWATPPFLHNGAAPSVFALLSPVSQRPKAFELGRREFDPVCLGYQLTARAATIGTAAAVCLDPAAGAAESRLTDLSKFDAAKPGNLNIGHEFSDEARPGVVGRALSVEERLAVIEFLKTDCANGPGHSGDVYKAGQDTSCEAIAYTPAPPQPAGEHASGAVCRFD